MAAVSIVAISHKRKPKTALRWRLVTGVAVVSGFVGATFNTWALVHA